MATDVELRCLCGLHKHVYELPASVKKLDYFVCHCNSCRAASGACLQQGAITWDYPLKSVSEAEQAPEDVKTLLRQYDFGPGLDFWYCDVCSTKMYWKYKKPDSVLEVFPGLIPEKLLLQGRLQMSCAAQVHVGDTQDQGLSTCFLDEKGAIGRRHQEGSQGPLYQVQPGDFASTPIPEEIRATCHCNSIILQLRSQSYSVEIDTSDRSRLMNSGAISVWAKIVSDDIVQMIDGPFDASREQSFTDNSKAAGALTRYLMDNGDLLYFCIKCSASIMVEPSSQPSFQPDQNPRRLGAGLLQSSRGARREDILDWKDVAPFEIRHRSIDFDPSKF